MNEWVKFTMNFETEGAEPEVFQIGDVVRKDDYWVCRVQRVGDEKQPSANVHGEDIFQVQLLTMEFIRRSLVATGKRFTLNGDPYWCVLPRPLPTTYGEPFYDKATEVVRKMIDEETYGIGDDWI